MKPDTSQIAATDFTNGASIGCKPDSLGRVYVTIGGDLLAFS